MEDGTKAEETSGNWSGQSLSEAAICGAMKTMNLSRKYGVEPHPFVASSMAAKSMFVNSNFLGSLAKTSAAVARYSAWSRWPHGRIG